MAAPPVTVRVVPGAGSYKIPDGFKSEITFASSPGAYFWEIDPKPPAIDGGEAIDTTTQLNVAWRTMAPQSLKKLDSIPIKVAYDPDIINPLLTVLINNRFDSVTIRFPTNDMQAFWGYMQKWDPEPLEIGKMPMATMTVVPTNFDVANQVEAGPIYQPAGT